MGKRVSFCESVNYLETHSKEVRILLNFKLYSFLFNLQDYDRTPYDDMDEDVIEGKIEKLNVHVKIMEVGTLMDVDFVDYHKMLNQLNDEEEPCCDFGIFAVVDHSDTDLSTGDVIISVDKEDFLDCTAAQLKTHLLKINGISNKSKVTIVYGNLTDI